ncbi:DUF4344 domain-containing metallopeptidase [Legionella quateirensis]|uniref:Uncharacterized protein n=1 Tax=Legionella quateirensis TaxID=45072 RepID=A0A378KWL0_9GAMM|nr:DUF4344 domain-containing metallopeptidase [Legionella quateirensis]KTD46307.1 hypothetical protein Lqua_2410 [Legionella quateirensis]STY18923.1 Uncharacterised protein [Legionella quateirensis]
MECYSVIIKSFVHGIISSSLLFFSYMPLTYAGEAKEYGKFIIIYEKPENKAQEAIKDLLNNPKNFDSLINSLNKELKLPQDIKIIYQTKRASAYYPSEKTIYIDYNTIIVSGATYFKEYIEDDENDVKSFSDAEKSDQDLINDHMVGLARFIIYHEIAHAIIDVFDLPIVGNDETAADNLSAILSLDLVKDGFSIALNAADAFVLMEYQSKQDKNNEEEEEQDAYWDEHALNLQRYYNILCLAYGKFPKKMIEEVSTWEDNKQEITFLIERKDYCKYQYLSEQRAWYRLLSPYLIQQETSSNESTADKPDGNASDESSDESDEESADTSEENSDEE